MIKRYDIFSNATGKLATTVRAHDFEVTGSGLLVFMLDHTAATAEHVPKDERLVVAVFDVKSYGVKQDGGNAW